MTPQQITLVQSSWTSAWQLLADAMKLAAYGVDSASH
jgi:hypothetical protein